MQFEVEHHEMGVLVLNFLKQQWIEAQLKITFLFNLSSALCRLSICFLSSALQKEKMMSVLGFNNGQAEKGGN